MLRLNAIFLRQSTFCLSNMSHSLVEIPRQDWAALAQLYAHRRTESVGYVCIKNFINWTYSEANVSIKCLSLDGDWQHDGTFILVANYGGPLSEIYFNTLNPDQKRLTAALKFLEIKEGEYVFVCYGKNLRPAVRAYEECFPQKPRFHDPSVWYHVSPEIVAGFTTYAPKGITLGKLSVKDASTVNNAWPHRHVGSEKYIASMIRFNLSVAAYDAAGNLVGWCIRLPFGALGVLQVLDTHKRLGLGSLMVRYLAKKIKELGDEVMAPVLVKNTPSRKMFEKLGFKAIDTVYWSEL